MTGKIKYIEESEFDYNDKMKVSLTHPDNDDLIIGHLITNDIYKDDQ